MVPETDRSFVVVKEIRRSKQDVEVVLNSQRRGRHNEVTQELADATVKIRTGYYAFEPFTETEMELVFVKPGTEGQVKIQWGKRQTTCLYSMGPLLALHPALKVERGFLRRFVCRLETTGETPRFLIQLNGSTVGPSPKKKKAKEAPSPAPDVK